ncbi:MAG: radical SAM protein [Deltaproteobacteria bacterium]|nr:radical SAM protein [Deltaproteobacteria bacterium]
MGRLSPEEALALFQSPWAELKQRAHARRSEIVPGHQATYLVMRIVSVTNVCVADCSYCAFYRRPGDPEAYVLTNEQIFQKIDELRSAGGSLVAMEGGFNPLLKIDHYEKLFRKIRDRYSDTIEIYGPTAVEVLYIANHSQISIDEALGRLWDAGLRWIPGGGAEILTPEWRKKLSPRKYSVEQYFKVMETAQKKGFGTTATMVIGFGENPEARVEHLQKVRELQDQTGGFKSFLCWTYQPDHTVLAGERVPNDEYLKTIAVSRLFLDNIPHLRTSLLTQGEKGVEALFCGADDFDIALEDQVTQKAGVKIEPDIQKVLGWVENVGMRPVKREPWQMSLTPPSLPLLQGEEPSIPPLGVRGG